MNEIHIAFKRTKFLKPLHLTRYYGKWQLVKKHVEWKGTEKKSETIVYGKGVSFGEKLHYAYNMISLGVLGLISGTAVATGIVIANSLIK